MARRITLAPDEFYHIYNRGTEKRTVFSTKGDYERFLALLYLCNSSDPVEVSSGRHAFERAVSVDRGKPLVQICSYCLMPNHFHLLIREVEYGGISRFMQKLATGYTMYFNERNDRTGALFQGRFKATHADDDRYLAYLISYIHLNPVKLIEPQWKEDGIRNRTKAEEYLGTYRYSSYLDYLGQDRAEGAILDKTALPEYFKTPSEFKAAVTQWLSYKEDKKKEEAGTEAGN